MNSYQYIYSIFLIVDCKKIILKFIKKHLYFIFVYGNILLNKTVGGHKDDEKINKINFKIKEN